MFKRIAKKQKKSELEEELGLDDESKQILGMHDTDSDESASSSAASGSGSGSDSESDDDSDSDEEAEIEGNDAPQTEFLAAVDDDSEDEDDAEEDYLDEPPMSIDEAIGNPLYKVPSDPDMHACIACPGKKLKNDRMVEAHLKSGTHVRRHRRFCKIVKEKGVKSDDPRHIAAAMDKPFAVKPAIADPEGLTRRGQKRKLAREQLIKKRQMQKKIIKRKRLERLEKKAAEAKENEAKAASKAGVLEDADQQRLKKKRKVKDDPFVDKKGQKHEKVAKLKAPDPSTVAATSETPTADTTTSNVLETAVDAITDARGEKKKKKKGKGKDSSKESGVPNEDGRRAVPTVQFASVLETGIKPVVVDSALRSNEPVTEVIPSAKGEKKRKKANRSSKETIPPNEDGRTVTCTPVVGSASAPEAGSAPEKDTKEKKKRLAALADTADAVAPSKSDRRKIKRPDKRAASKSAPHDRKGNQEKSSKHAAHDEKRPFNSKSSRYYDTGADAVAVGSLKKSKGSMDEKKARKRKREEERGLEIFD